MQEMKTSNKQSAAEENQQEAKRLRENQQEIKNIKQKPISTE